MSEMDHDRIWNHLHPDSRLNLENEIPNYMAVGTSHDPYLHTPSAASSSRLPPANTAGLSAVGQWSQGSVSMDPPRMVLSSEVSSLNHEMNQSLAGSSVTDNNMEIDATLEDDRRQGVEAMVAPRHPRPPLIIGRNNERNGRARNFYDRFQSFSDEDNTRNRWISEGVAIMDRSTFYDSRNYFDQHRNMRLDIDNMSYEELLALGERIGYVSTGLHLINHSQMSEMDHDRIWNHLHPDSRLNLENEIPNYMAVGTSHDPYLHTPSAASSSRLPPANTAGLSAVGQWSQGSVSMDPPRMVLSSEVSSLNHEMNQSLAGSSVTDNNMEIDATLEDDRRQGVEAMVAPRHPRPPLIIGRNNERNGRARNFYDRFQSFSDEDNTRNRWISEGVAIMDRSTFYDSRNYFDQHRNMRLDIDNMSYEELLALGERIGYVSTGLSEDAISRCLMETIYCSSKQNQDDEEELKCAICLVFRILFSCMMFGMRSGMLWLDEWSDTLPEENAAREVFTTVPGKPNLLQQIEEKDFLAVVSHAWNIESKMSGDVGVSAFPEGENIFSWIGTIEGSKGTPYEGLSFKLSLRFPYDYPFKPPQVKFETPCFHPNIDHCGNICLDILQDMWSSAYDCRTILLSIQSLLGEPNNESPLNSYAATLWSNQEGEVAFGH
ncbi:hypothetical protein COCNU_04G003020 [Cocos nucifera]|uniref:RING-type E3 ubiquitin transferase n=1 Tax=Cocos nucifera TaxID=13894 RepID=A0A8K0I520_COCNU|nr:hypothetical protein COCNU_04G003020 [Cocos nucifera]